jgi:hypothetical protein
MIRPYTYKTIDFFFKHGIRFGFNINTGWFSLGGQSYEVRRPTYKTWVVTHMGHAYKFMNQQQLLEWIENERKYGE